METKKSVDCTPPEGCGPGGRLVGVME